MVQYDVHRPHGKCEVTGKPIEEGSEFYSVLFDDGDTFRRADFSSEAWEGPPENAYCFFKSRLPVREKRRKTLIDDQMLREFFLRLSGESQKARLQFRFVLALILMRKRLLRYERSHEADGIDTWDMRFVGDDQTHKVINPQLTDDEIEDVSRQLSSIMHADMGRWALEEDEPEIIANEHADPGDQSDA